MAVFDSHFGGYRIFVGDLGRQSTRYDVEREYERYGQLVDVWVARNPPGFAFVVFKNLDECERAVRKSHGRRLCGRRVRVEYARPFDDRSGKQLPIRFTNRDRSPRRHRSRSRDSSRSRSPRRHSRSPRRRRRSSRHRRSGSANKGPSRFCREKRQTSDEPQYRSTSVSPKVSVSNSPVLCKESRDDCSQSQVDNKGVTVDSV